mgnify:CR=1 FL=1
MKFAKHYITKWHDTDANREVHPSGVLMFMQETGNRQFEAAGRPLDAPHPPIMKYQTLNYCLTTQSGIENQKKNRPPHLEIGSL